MLTLEINGQPLVLSPDTNITYTHTNNDFEDVGGFTLQITVPLRGVPENIAVLGEYFRKGVTLPSSQMPARLVAPPLDLEGVVILFEANEKECQLQFLDNESIANNADPFVIEYGDTYIRYINEINDSYPIVNIVNDIPTEGGYTTDGARGLVLPWVNATTGNLQPGYIANHISPKQIFLIPFLEFILNKFGFTLETTSAFRSFFGDMLIMNALPDTWQLPSSRALPHWTVTELLDEVGKLTMHSWKMDIVNRKIIFTRRGPEQITTIAQPLLTFKAKQAREGDCKHLLLKQFKYSDRGDTEWRRLTEFTNTIDYLASYPNRITNLTFTDGMQLPNTTIASLAQENASNDQEAFDTYTSMHYTEIYRVTGIFDQGYTVETRYYYSYIASVRRATRQEVLDAGKDWEQPGIYWWFITYYFRPLNTFAPYPKQADGETVEMKIVPIRQIEMPDDNTRFYPALDCGEYDPTGNNDPAEYLVDSYKKSADRMFNIDVTEFFDKLYVAFYNNQVNINTDTDDRTPTVDSYRLSPSGILKEDNAGTLILEQTNSLLDYSSLLKDKTIDTHFKYSFQWMQTDGLLPEVRNIFRIEGQEYICEKLEATFTSDGLSPLLKGEFWRIIPNS
ncbi:MAG: hypothetical protein IJS00_04325 [Paludibacteraceae bacterium]|nr:hypothetical protein [Paludibacteraceae bacterium]